MDRFLQLFRYAAAVVLAVAVLFNAAAVNSAAVDMPFMDEWEAYAHEPLPEALDLSALKWLVSQHNEHRIVPTRALTYALYLWNGWSVRQNALIGFGLYCGIAVFWLVMAWRLVEARYLGFVVFALVFFFCARHAENLAWAYQTSFHFALLNFLIGTAFLFAPRQRPWQLALGAGLLTLGVYSLAADLVAAIAVCAVFAVFKIVRGETRAGILTILPIAVGFALYFVGLEPGAVAPRAALTSRAFRDFLFNLVSHGFGVEQWSPRIGRTWLAAALFPFVALFLRREARRGDQGAYFLFAICGGVLAMYFAIAYGRSMNGPEQAKAGRYAVVGLLLLPAMLLALARWRPEKPAVVVTLATLILGAAFVSHADNWNYAASYGMMKDLKTRGTDCARAYYFYGGSGNCYWLYPAPLPPYLDTARARGAHFYKELEAQHKELAAP